MSLSPTARATTFNLLLKLLGSEIVGHMQDPLVEDIFLNANGTVFVRYAGRKVRLDVRVDAEAMSLVIGYAGTLIGMTADGVSRFAVDGKLPSGQRFHGVVPPRAAQGPYVVMRNPSRTIHTLGGYVEQGVMTEAVADQLRRDVDDAKTIVIGGVTGAGKTSLMTCLVNTGAARAARIVLLEDAEEVNVDGIEDRVVKSTLGGTMDELAYDALRERPERIYIGEVRDRTMKTWIEVVGTGHPGSMLTLHAGSPRGVMVRAEQLVSEAVVDVAGQRAVLCDTIERIVVVALGRDGRRRVPGVYAPVKYNSAGRYEIRAVAGDEDYAIT